jgi:small subunit ribosomal protein S9
VKPLAVTQSAAKYDVRVNVEGGGATGQAGAVSLGIARALVGLNDENKALLRAAGLMTRDPRMVERKKYGQRKARKRFQFSKR